MEIKKKYIIIGSINIKMNARVFKRLITIERGELPKILVLDPTNSKSAQVQYFQYFTPQNL